MVQRLIMSSLILKNAFTEEECCDHASESDDDLACIGFMFDTAHAKTSEKFIFSDLSGKEFSVDLNRIKGDPGHVQSGQYLWPAAQFAVEWIAAHAPELDLLPNSMCCSTQNTERGVSNALSILELGAGCGLTALGVSQLCPERLVSVVLTDRDYGSLQLLDQNASILCKRLGDTAFPMYLQKRVAEIQQDHRITSKSSGDRTATVSQNQPTPSSPQNPSCSLFLAHKLDWGEAVPTELMERCQSHIQLCTSDVLSTLTGHASPSSGQEIISMPVQLLLLGSDLLYSIDVVAPLFHSVTQMLVHHKSGSSARQTTGLEDAANDDQVQKNIKSERACSKKGVFVLTSSFDVGEQINEEVTRQLQLKGLEVIERAPLDMQSGLCRVQIFSLL